MTLHCPSEKRTSWKWYVFHTMIGGRIDNDAPYLQPSSQSGSTEKHQDNNANGDNAGMDDIEKGDSPFILETEITSCGRNHWPSEYEFGLRHI